MQLPPQPQSLVVSPLSSPLLPLPTPTIPLPHIQVHIYSAIYLACLEHVDKENTHRTSLQSVRCTDYVKKTYELWQLRFALYVDEIYLLSLQPPGQSRRLLNSDSENILQQIQVRPQLLNICNVVELP